RHQPPQRWGTRGCNSRAARATTFKLGGVNPALIRTAGLCRHHDDVGRVVRGAIRRVVGAYDCRDDGARSSLWWGTKNECLGLLDVAGLEVEALDGGFAREPLDEKHSRICVREPVAADLEWAPPERELGRFLVSKNRLYDVFVWRSTSSERNLRRLIST